MDSRTRSDTGLSYLESRFSKAVTIGDYIKQVERMAKDIAARKEGFLNKCLDVDKKIEQAMRDINAGAKETKREIEKQLEKIKKTEISSWNRQMRICKEAEDWLKNVRTDVPSFCEDLQKTCRMYAADIGFINSSEIRFEQNYSSILHCIKNFGKVSHGKTKGPEKSRARCCLGNWVQSAGLFNKPWSVCTDATGRILIADSANDKIQVFNELGVFLFEFGNPGIRAGEFRKPVGITVDKNCRIIITDKNNHRVQVFTFSGGFSFMFGRRGDQPGQFEHPWGVDTNSVGDIAVADSKNHRVQLFTKNGMFATEFKFDNAVTGLKFPICTRGVVFKPDGALLVTDEKIGFVFEIDAEFSTATKVQGCCDFNKLQGVARNTRGKFDKGFDNREKPRIHRGSGKHKDISSSVGCTKARYGADFRSKQHSLFE